jgi:hypothetical protein
MDTYTSFFLFRCEFLVQRGEPLIDEPSITETCLEFEKQIDKLTEVMAPMSLVAFRAAPAMKQLFKSCKFDIGFVSRSSIRWSFLQLNHATLVKRERSAISHSLVIILLFKIDEIMHLTALS